MKTQFKKKNFKTTNKIIKIKFKKISNNNLKKLKPNKIKKKSQIIKIMK